MGPQAAVDGYAAAADGLIPRYRGIDPAAVYAPVADLLPHGPIRVLDVGAGVGRDAAWFAARGASVLAVEPVAAFRAAAAADPAAAAVEWLDDRLPDLPNLAARSETFDLVILNGVLHHLPERLRPRALARLRRLTAADGLLVLSLRHGPGAPGRPSHPVPADRVSAEAVAAGFRPRLRVERPSLQAANRAAGVRWTWLALCADPV